MGRRPTKAADNPFCRARMSAAQYNERLFSKEGAAELLGVSVSTLSDYELGITKTIPPDMVLKMADLYNAPELRNYYCTEMCPLGECVAKADVASLDRITIMAMSSFEKMDETKQQLLKIVADGVVSEDEKSEMLAVVRNLGELEGIAQNLKNWVKKNMQEDPL